MKLVELLAREIVEWPEGAEMAVQDDDGCFKFGAGRNPKDDGYGIWVRDIEVEHELYNGFISSEKTIDRNTAIVTRAQWQAERDRQKGSEWKRHRGGKQPVAGGVVVECRHRNKTFSSREASGYLWWDHSESSNPDMDIMQYRVISQLHAEEVKLSKPEAREPFMGKPEVFYLEAKTDQIDGPIKWRDTIIHCQAIIEDCEREIERNVQLLANEGFVLTQQNPSIPDISSHDEPKEGDIMRCVDIGMTCADLSIGKEYIVCNRGGDLGVIDDEGAHMMGCIDSGELELVRRP